VNSKPTQYAFKAGAAYFICMAIAHFFSIKVPVLFIYFDTPFYAYQDKIISFAVCAYVALFHSASLYRPVALNAIFVLALTVVGLIAVNLSDALASVLSPEQTTMPYWLETFAILMYLLTLIGFYIKDGKNT
jgi:hypothetical protein